jgi:hypothetical protein
MMYDELSAALPEAVYGALDANGHLGAAARAKLQEAFRKSTSGAIFDPAGGAPFGHQFRLALAEGSCFDPVKRGLALAIAWRSGWARNWLRQRLDGSYWPPLHPP